MTNNVNKIFDSNASLRRAIRKNRAGKMDESLQKALGVKKLDDPMLPGLRARDLGRVLYASRPNGVKTSEAFDEISRRNGPPIAKSGGAIMEHWHIKTPEEEIFYSIFLVGDIEGWRKQIELSANDLGVRLATIEGEYFVISNGPSFPLAECEIALKHN